ncbi:MAG: prepilin-type N-terminal cleavage/methylation domain-containing protein [Opitutaceae bacterium]|nr:prepilin-type N-terminal cleavage/methylation domain-containing protein [Opitutaceae bacterium]
MVLYCYLTKISALRTHGLRALRGFSLLEIVLVLFVLGILAAAVAPSLREIVERGRRDAEAKTLDELANTLATTFDATDLTNDNIAALPGTIGAGDTATRFSNSTTATSATTAVADWFAKAARARGLTPQVGVAPTTAAQPALAQIAYNPTGNPRLLFAGPSESGRQRFLLLSLTARSDQLVLPPYEITAAWFDALWNNDWESRTAQPPAYWTGKLTAAQLVAWTQGSSGLTQVYRLCVRRIILPKFTVTVNNNHPTDSAFVSFNNTSPAFTAPANSGANVTPEILGGRLVTLNRGTSLPGVQALQFRLRENATITVQ